MKNITLITGASAGIGEACARRFAAAGSSLILTGRRSNRLQTLSAELEAAHGIAVLPLEFDVQQRQEVEKQLGNLPAEWQNIRVLINNAGLAARRDFFEEADMEDWETMLNTNVHGLLYVTRAVLPFMIKVPNAQIINLGSIAGKEVYEKGNVYCASKFAVDALSKSMRIDLLRHRIRVTNISPGAVETEFALVRFKGNETMAAATYQGLQPLTATDVADSVFYCTQLPPHVCINELEITCTQQAGTYYFNRNLASNS
jgi:3-hydroxy acid dehydrogenase/malonic semialdehyde reductase